jgi:hypothetical protein
MKSIALRRSVTTMGRRTLAAVLGGVAAVAVAGAALSAPLRLVSDRYADPVLSQVVIRWRCDRLPGQNVVYEGYIDALPRGTAATIVEGRMWLGASGMSAREVAILFRHAGRRFSPAAEVPEGPSGSFNLTPFRIVRGDGSCSSPVSVYWWPVADDGPQLAGSPGAGWADVEAHEFPLR